MSLVLSYIVDKDLTSDISKIRQSLPDSPFRIDPPHLTLLQGVTSAHYRNDAQLIADVKPIVDTLITPKSMGTIEGVNNMDSHLYGQTSVTKLILNEFFISTRRNLIRQLQSKEYMIEEREVNNYNPHVTIGLGVPLLSDQYKFTQKIIINGHKILFTDWRIFRLLLENGKRMVHEVEQK